MRRTAISLATVALIAMMVGCVPADHSLTISSTEGGEVISPGEGTYTYYEGEVVSLVAVTESGYRFENWTGDVGTIAGVSDATTTITMNGDYDIIANFVGETPTPAPSVLTVGGSGRYATIQEAINSARSGDTIQTAQGIYMENITIETSKTLRLEGGWDSKFSSRSNNSSLTIIDGGEKASVISIVAGDNTVLDLTVEGFTVQNGKSQGCGGGFYIESHSGCVDVTLVDNIIRNNMAAKYSGGGICAISLDGSVSVTLTRNTIIGNSAPNLDGGGVVAYARYQGSTSLNLSNNLIAENYAPFGGGILGYAWGPDGILRMTLTNNIITQNKADWGAGIFCCCGKTCDESLPDGSVIWKLANNTITRNEAQFVGGIFLYSGSTYGDGGLISLSMRNDILWGNPGDGPQLQLTVEPGKSGIATADVSYCNIGLVDTHGGTCTTQHVINKDPLFLDPARRVFLLKDSSLCIDSGDPDPSFNDGKCPPGKGTERNDMGAYGGPKNYDWSDSVSDITRD
jgi:hypothetical protein